MNVGQKKLASLPVGSSLRWFFFFMFALCRLGGVESVALSKVRCVGVLPGNERISRNDQHVVFPISSGQQIKQKRFRD